MSTPTSISTPTLTKNSIAMHLHTLATWQAIPRADLPPSSPERRSLHGELHARPHARITMPARIRYIALWHQQQDARFELLHLARWLGQSVVVDALSGERPAGFFNWNNGDEANGLPATQKLRYERHTEFTRYTLIESWDGASEPAHEDAPALRDWLAHIPGQTFCAIDMVLLHADIEETAAVLEQCEGVFNPRHLVASRLGAASDRAAHSIMASDFLLTRDGWMRMAFFAPPGTSASRAGRVTQRVLDAETYRLLALRGFGLTKTLGAQLEAMESELTAVTAAFGQEAASDAELLDKLVDLAARVSQAHSQYSNPFAASSAYYSIVEQRLREMRERPIYGTTMLGEFLQRRMQPAMATVRASENRLQRLASHIDHASDLLRTRVNIAAEAQNQELLAKLNAGQELQLRLQSTVEGLSIAAISYYVVSLILYAAKAAQGAGLLSIKPEVVAGASIPFVLWAVWRVSRRIHARFLKH